MTPVNPEGKLGAHNLDHESKPPPAMKVLLEEFRMSQPQRHGELQ